MGKSNSFLGNCQTRAGLAHQPEDLTVAEGFSTSQNEGEGSGPDVQMTQLRGLLLL